MQVWADVDEAIESALQAQAKKMDNLVQISSLLILGAGVWLAWPAIQSALSGGEELLAGFAPALVVLLWGLLVQDIIIDDPKARSRIGVSASILWPILLQFAILKASSNLSVAVGSGILILIAYLCRNESRSVYQSGLDHLRFRAVMTGVGLMSATALFVGMMPEQMSTHWMASVAVLTLIVVDVVMTWVVGDDKKEERKAFRKRLDAIENRLLELKAKGAAVAQASSLVTTASEEGHLDPDYGMRLLDEAEEDISRALSLADDVEIIMKDARDAVEKAEGIAPSAKRPRKAFEMAEREVELGSLREGEQLFRTAKKRALEVIEWWAKAEQAIQEASRQLDGKKGDGISHLREMLGDAKKKLASESPKKAFEYAIVIPQQLSADGDALERGSESIEEAKKQLENIDGLDVSELLVRLEQAEAALEAGNAAQAIGLAEGVSRALVNEREAMSHVQKALRQKKKITSQFAGRDDESDWHARMDEIESASDSKQWTHAAALLDRLTSDLDKEGKASDEALELYDFVMEEWRVLRNQCEAAFIQSTDPVRMECEKAIALAEEALGVGRIEDCLSHLSSADTAMEKLRRKI